MKEEQTSSGNEIKKSKGGRPLVKRSMSVDKKTISIPKTDQESIGLVSLVLEKCNKSNIGRKVNLTDIFLYSIRKLKELDYESIKEETLTLEEKAEKSLSEFNHKNGTSLTMIELAIKQLKKEKKETLQ